MKIFRRKKKNKFHEFIRIVIVATSIVLFWWGVWGLLDLYFFPDNLTVGYILGAALGLLLLFIDDLSIDELGENR